MTSISINERVFSVSFKNSQVKKCLTVAGKALELRFYLAALEAIESDGSKSYNNVMNGVFINWDGKFGTKGIGHDTVNEIDIVMMHGLVPVFVSCKNGIVTNSELFKLNSVADRFGGKYAKKVLVASSLDEQDNAEYIRQRCIDMKIRLIEGCTRNKETIKLAEMDDSDFNKTVRSFWSN